ncbi:MAG: asparagine synthase, partial [Alphaproteobacteria bacterium]
MAANHGGGGSRVWAGTGAALAYVPRPFTPEDHLDRLPASFSGGRSRLVFDGRLDNRDDLSAALGLENPKASRLGDAGLVMAALDRWGVDACPRLIGAFALGWW